MAAPKKPGGNAGKGRPKGSRNKKNLELREAARQYTPEALAKLADVMRNSDNDQAAVSAANALLDRGWGKPSQHHSVDQNLTLRDERQQQISEAIGDIFARPAAKPADAPRSSGKVVH